MNNKKFRGIFGIPVTPFNNDESIDYKSLEKVINFTVENGCNGIVMPVMASEYQTLTDEERKKIISETTKIVNGKIPVVAVITGMSNIHSLELGLFAESIGVDRVIAMAPFSSPTNFNEIFSFFELLSNNLTVPIFIQNHSIGAVMNSEQLYKICVNLDNVNYVKEESKFPGQVSSSLLELDKNNNCYGVMSGYSGRFLIDDFKRGISGCMPGSHYGDIHSNIWNLLENNKEDKAREIYDRLLPLINIENLYGIPVFKEILYTRGIISNTLVRSPGKTSLDKYDHKEINFLFDSIRDLFTWEN